MPVAVDAEGLSKTFHTSSGAIKAGDNLNLSIPSRQVFGFLGPNGAGKTTTIKMLLGLVTLNAGAARLRGRALPKNRAPIDGKTGTIEAGEIVLDSLCLGISRFAGHSSVKR